MSNINIDELLKILPKLIRENDTVKGAIITALSGVVATHDDILELTKTMNERFEKMDTRFEKMDTRFEKMDTRFEKMDKRFEKMDARFEKMDKRFEKMDARFETMDARFETMDKRFETLIKEMKRGFEEARKEREILRVGIATISSRSGERLEDLVLNILSEKLLQENIERSKISRKELVDREGKVYFDNYQTDVDVVIQDGKTILIEVKSTADNRDIFDLQKKAELFKIVSGEDYDELMLVCLEINRFNFEQAIKQGIHVIAEKII
ncbi:MAG: hypothetical protein EU544_04510 [Promethearchaeota archaeon]|nr:MAG: hypothetical protein EU544_04510 [Candidatus Lokiarchaeota archaeon]